MGYNGEKNYVFFKTKEGAIFEVGTGGIYIQATDDLSEKILTKACKKELSFTESFFTGDDFFRFGTYQNVTFAYKEEKRHLVWCVVFHSREVLNYFLHNILCAAPKDE